MRSHVTFRNTDLAHAPLGLHSHSATVPSDTELVFVSGQVGVKSDGTVGRTLADQADQAFQNVVSILAANDLGPKDIIKLNTYIVPDDSEGAVRAARLKYLGKHRPISTAVWVRRLVDKAWLVEVEAIAACPSKS